MVDDHQTFTELLGAALDREPDFACAGIASSPADALEAAVGLQPDLVVMDIKLGSDNGLDVARRIREALPEAVIVVVSAHREAEWVARASLSGASAFAPKSGSLAEMLAILRQAKHGSMLIGPSTFPDGTSHQPVDVPGVAPLSAREREVLTLLARGLPASEIALLMHISPHTCRGYLKAIHAKLKVRSQLEAVIKAQRLGLVEIELDDA